MALLIKTNKRFARIFLLKLTAVALVFLFFAQNFALTPAAVFAKAPNDPVIPNPMNYPAPLPIPHPPVPGYQYDQNGNVTSDGVSAYTYDYNNRLVSATNSTTGTVSTYLYDYKGQRVKSTVTTRDGKVTTTYYPNSGYNVSETRNNVAPVGTTPPTTTTVTKHVFANNQDIATINTTASGTAVFYMPYPKIRTVW